MSRPIFFSIYNGKSSQLVKPVTQFLMCIIAKLLKEVQGNKQAARQPGDKSKYVNKGKDPVPGQASKGERNVIFEHMGRLG
jgi:hypothetical protein